MPVKDVLLHLDRSAEAEIRLDFAMGLALAHGAHLTALHAVDPVMPPGLAGEGGGAALAALMQQLADEADAAAASQRTAFEERLRREGLSGEWRQASFAAADKVALHARYADLTVLGQPNPDSRHESATIAVLEAVLFNSGRPILMVPYAGRPAPIGKRALVAWNASKEAARALGDALPLLSACEQITVVAVNPRRGIGGDGDVPAADIALHLARHGLNATAEHIEASGISDSDVLLNAVADRGADLLVMGAYGHSRLREMILGGVTRGILARMTVPVLMAH
jgi:nucleotide-binding universal stress UspA family protein